MPKTRQLSMDAPWSQVQDYACLYTSHASNLAFIAPDTSFRAPSDLMPHDRLL